MATKRPDVFVLDKTKEALLWGRMNGNKLRSCAGPHDFVELKTIHRYGCTHRCSKCAGDVHELAVGWYLMGLAHGRLGK